MAWKNPVSLLVRGGAVAAVVLGLAGCAPLEGPGAPGRGAFVYGAPPSGAFGYYRSAPPVIRVDPPIYGYRQPHFHGRRPPPGWWDRGDYYRGQPSPHRPPLYAGPGVYGPRSPYWGHDRHRVRSYRGNGRCDDPRYETSNGGRARAGSDEYDCSRYGDGLKGRYR